MKTFFLSVIFIVGISAIASGQKDIPLARQTFHRKIDKSQLALSSSDRTMDGQFTPYGDNDILNKASNEAATKGVNELQSNIEDQDWDNNTKLKYLRGLLELLDRYRSSFLAKGLTGAEFVTALKAFKEAMAVDHHGGDITPVIDKYKYGVAILIVKDYAFQRNIGKDSFGNLLLRKELDEHPSNALDILNTSLLDKRPFSDIDNILQKVALDSSDAIYTWAQAYSNNYPLGSYIRNSGDPLIKVISKIANSNAGSGTNNGRQYMPFLDELYHGNLGMDEISATLDQPVQYFKLLVRTEISYAERAANHNTVIAREDIKRKIHDVGVDKFINIINGLHEKSNDVRYACLRPLSALDLYYLSVTSEIELYTSSYVNGKNYGIYNTIWQKGGKGFTADSLMKAVKFDYFKKWIKMAANYNTLDDFLLRMQPVNAQMMMKDFVRNLDKSSAKDSLEDAVDVAGSYASIDQSSIKKLVLSEVLSSLQKAKQGHNKKAFNIYNILNTLFLSMDSSNKIDVADKLGIDPVYFMAINKLKDPNGKVVVQQTTYGDEDGRANYNNFMEAFARLGWKVTSNQYWSVVSSTKGTPIAIYTNKPLDENRHLDDDAQNALNSYLDENDIHPTLMFHRGHSYYLPSTIKQMQASEKIVFVGSCGGYQSMDSILKMAPGAQIISTRQTGAGDLNLPMIVGIVTALQKGKDLNWVQMWKHFSNSLSGDSRFVDYVPPYENLAAVFLVAYQKLQDREKEQVDIKNIVD